MPKRVDANQPAIVAELRQMGYRVAVISDLGRGLPDIIVGGHGLVFLCEVKNPEEKWSLTPSEREFHELWSGMVHIVETTEDILDLIYATTSSPTKI